MLICASAPVIFSVVIAGVFSLSIASVPTSAQEVSRQSRSRWEKLMYQDTKALIQETSVEIAKNAQNAISLRMLTSAYYRNSEAENGKSDAAAAHSLLQDPATAEEFQARCYAERRIEKYNKAITYCTKAITHEPK